jgi:hypothetical protein
MTYTDGPHLSVPWPSKIEFSSPVTLLGKMRGGSASRGLNFLGASVGLCCPTGPIASVSFVDATCSDNGLRSTPENTIQCDIGLLKY